MALLGAARLLRLGAGRLELRRGPLGLRRGRLGGARGRPLRLVAGYAPSALRGAWGALNLGRRSAAVWITESQAQEPACVARVAACHLLGGANGHDGPTP